MTPFAAILPAAGRSTRFGSDKLLTPLAGRPLIAHALAAFLARPDVAAIVIPTHQKQAMAAALEPLGLLSDHRVVFCAGGPTREQSVEHAVRVVAPQIEWVAVHDAARPLISQGLIDRTLAAAREHGAAVPAMPVQLTVKQASGPLPAPVMRTIPRNTLWAMQTPQIMRRSALLRAIDHCPVPLAEVTDDAQLLELVGASVWLIEGEERNLKITTATDLRVAEMLLAAG